MRAVLTLLIGVGLGLGAFYLARTVLPPEARGPKAVEIVFAADMDLQAELDKLAEGERAVVVIPNGDDVQKRVTEAFILCPAGSTLQFQEGVYKLTNQLQLATTKGPDGAVDVDKSNVTVRGAGRDKTVLNFSEQLAGTGGEGLLVKADGFTIADLTVEETKGDAIKVEGADGVVFRNVATLWRDEGNPKNGAYGVYPVLCKNVLIEYCVAEGASDAGIYVGQSENIIVRYSQARKNVAGIEIENSKNADVYENEATNNAGGLLVFDLPSLPAGNGGGHRVYKNRVYANNHVNFAPPGNIVANVPQGTGLMIMATDDVEVFNNEIVDNQSTNVSIISFVFTGNPIQDANYDAYPERIYVHDNRIANGGSNPAGSVKLLAPLVGTPLPDILADGLRKPGSNKDEQILFIENNGEATYVNLRLDLVEDQESLKDPTKRVAAFLANASNIEKDLSKVGGRASLRDKPVVLKDLELN